MRRVLLSGRDTYLSGLSKRHTCVMRLIKSLVATLKTNMVLSSIEDSTTEASITLEGVCINSLEVTASLSE